MIVIDKFSQIDLSTDEGKLLLAALSVLTSMDERDIKKRRWGGMISPDQAHQQVVDLANKIFFEEEYKTEKIRKRKERKRTRMINKILT